MLTPRLPWQGHRRADDHIEALSTPERSALIAAVMDIYLSARDGIETARVLRDLCGVQVVFVTAYSDDEGLAEHRGRWRSDVRRIRASAWHSTILYNDLTHRERSPNRTACRFSRSANGT
jgi:hypothetical protein